MYGVKVPQTFLGPGPVGSQLSVFLKWLVDLLSHYLNAHEAAGKAPVGSQLSVAIEWLINAVKSWDWTHLGAQAALPIIAYLQDSVLPDLREQGGVYLLIAPIVESLLAAAKAWAEAELANPVPPA